MFESPQTAIQQFTYRNDVQHTQPFLSPAISLCVLPSSWMLQIEVTTPSPEPSRPITLADLSRNASVISSSSSSSASDSVFVNTPRPRPIRQFSSPRSRSPHSPTVRSSSKPPAYLTKELGVAGHDRLDNQPDISAQAQSRSRNSSAGRRISANDFEFGEILGEGSYSTVSLIVNPLLSSTSYVNAGHACHIPTQRT